MKKQEDLISIIVPVYNVEKYLYRCLNSLIHQTYHNLQIIVVDDGSTDASYKVASEFLEKDSRIEVYKKENGGVSDARNFGLQYVKGSYISFVDSDDWITKDYVETLKNMLKEDVDISCAAYDIHDDYKSRRGYYYIKNKTLSSSDALIELCKNTWLPTVVYAKMYRAELFDDISFIKGLLHEDVVIMHILFSKAKNISCSSKVIYHYYIHNDSITHQNTGKRHMDHFRVFCERYNFLEEERAKKYTLRQCLDCCYRILYIMTDLNYEEEDLKFLTSFWEQHKNTKNMGVKYYLKCQHPLFYLFVRNFWYNIQQRIFFKPR